ncbi:MAG TPA: thiolase family protein [Syntrophales bacterium]|nr:thiolase family protein [Syntrophales bacterium]HOM07380.1 thiolase family protein [Syntrophales bacterium]HON98915.1 thiolase family protein [Syntrophales bacterium]HPC00379.1 thiolase family protein [Syntrophales bacterium]HPQ06982.1 thiolase family protein [Syntrophales bacterium]
MSRKVAIVSVAQSAGAESKDNFFDQAYRVTKEVLDKAGITRDELGSVVSASSDVYHGGISCANAYYWDPTGAFLKNASRQDGESLFALMYGAMRIMTGHFDTVLVIGLCKGSENPDNETCTLMYSDPFYLRPLGLTETMAAAFQMKQYLERYGIEKEQCAKVAVKNLGNALLNPYAHRRGRYSVEEVLRSDLVVDPLTALQCAPKSEGMVAMLLASEEKATKMTKKPVWIKGFASALDAYMIGDRDLLDSRLPAAAKKAYDMAGIKDPAREIDLAEITEPYAFQELLWYENLGFCGEGEGGKLIDRGFTDRDGELPVNPSGGVLANNPYVSRGLQRAVEAFLQIRGEAGEHQVPKQVKTALAHGVHGFAGQCHAVAILGS